MREKRISSSVETWGTRTMAGHFGQPLCEGPQIGRSPTFYRRQRPPSPFPILWQAETAQQKQETERKEREKERERRREREETDNTLLEIHSPVVLRSLLYPLSPFSTCSGLKSFLPVPRSFSLDEGRKGREREREREKGNPILLFLSISRKSPLFFFFRGVRRCSL